MDYTFLQTPLDALIVALRKTDREQTLEVIRSFPDSFPVLNSCDGVVQGRFHYEPVLDHMVTVACKVAPMYDVEISLAALYHDCGKPKTRESIPGGGVTFKGHDKVGADLAVEELRAMGVKETRLNRIHKLVYNHMRTKKFGDEYAATDKALKRLLRDMGDDFHGLLEIIDADNKSHAPDACMINQVANIRLRVPKLIDHMTASVSSPVSGDAIMLALSLSPGPAIGILRRTAEQIYRRDPNISEGDLLALLKLIYTGKS